MSSRQGRRNTKPTRSEVASYYRLLKSAAESGDTDAARHLIDLHERHCSEQRENKRDGV
ncbi:MAG: hypothetical protein AWU55_2345 [Halomonadaceae bacterium T82-2]|nr:MAG: hypothetical protein AWU55_2345 [Halomonadaceae bacterium T82-2]